MKILKTDCFLVCCSTQVCYFFLFFWLRLQKKSGFLLRTFFFLAVCLLIRGSCAVYIWLDFFPFSVKFTFLLEFSPVFHVLSTIFHHFSSRTRCSCSLIPQLPSSCSAGEWLSLVLRLPGGVFPWPRALPVPCFGSPFYVVMVASRKSFMFSPFNRFCFAAFSCRLHC